MSAAWGSDELPLISSMFHAAFASDRRLSCPWLCVATGSIPKITSHVRPITEKTARATSRTCPPKAVCMAPRQYSLIARANRVQLALEPLQMFPQRADLLVDHLLQNVPRDCLVHILLGSIGRGHGRACTLECVQVHAHNDAGELADRRFGARQFIEDASDGTKPESSMPKEIPACITLQ